MNITRTIQNKVETMPPGQVFGYQDLPGYNSSSSAVIKAVSRMVEEKRLERFSKGKFYVPKKGALGLRKPSDGELIRSVLYKDGRLRGYVTGLSLYNQLGLTTQVPRTITVAFNGGRQEKEYATIRIKKIVTRVPVEEKNVQLLQYLDALKDIKKIPDSDINLSLKIMKNYIAKLPKTKQKRLLELAEEYYSPQVKALVGMLYTSIGLKVPKGLSSSLNPTTTYKLKLDKSLWPLAREWNIQ